MKIGSSIQLFFLRRASVIEYYFLKKRAKERQVFLAKESPVIVLGRGKSGTRLLPKCLSKLGVVMNTGEDSIASDINWKPFQLAVKYLAEKYIGATNIDDIDIVDQIFFQKVKLNLTIYMFPLITPLLRCMTAAAAQSASIPRLKASN